MLLGNNTKNAITILRKTFLGNLHYIEKVVMTGSLETPKPTVTINSAVSKSTDTSPALWQPPVNLSHLNNEKRAKLNKMLCEDSWVFTHDCNDIGDADVNHP